MTVRIDVMDLRRFVDDTFRASGLGAYAARTATDVVCYADEHGHTTHGCNALADIYVPRLRNGRISAKAVPEVVEDGGAVAVLDGGHGLGLVAMTEAVDLAAGKARANGIGMVAVRHSSHFGSAGYYSSRLAKQGLIGLTFTNCGPQGVAPPLGGAVRMLGTNPLSAAVPSGHQPPFVLDMSTTVVATGKIHAAQARGEDLPDGWLHDRAGATVTDPSRYYDGTADVAWLGGPQVTGGAKGFGLALLVDALCGPLAGAAFGPRRAVLDGLASEADSDVGHVAIAIDPAAFGVADSFDAGMDELLATVRACPPARPGARITYPGAPEAETAARSAVDGVAIPDAVDAKLRALAATLAVAEPRPVAEEVTV